MGPAPHNAMGPYFAPKPPSAGFCRGEAAMYVLGAIFLGATFSLVPWEHITTDRSSQLPAKRCRLAWGRHGSGVKGMDGAAGA